MAEGPRDRISLRDHVVTVEIGAFQQERGHRQRIRFNVVVEVRPHAADLADDVDRILSYDKVTEAIATELAAERLNLLETLAERVADRILLEPLAMRVFIRIEKLDRGPGALGVEIMRARKPVAPPPAPRLHPRVVYLSQAALHAPHLTGWLDQIDRAAQRGDQPAILCVGPLEQAAPQVGNPLVQRRVDLLALEQAAWVLAARDRRCVVVATRTELDWAMRHGRLSVWAPSKIVLDAVDCPAVSLDPGGDHALALVIWFAGLMQATALTVIGADPVDVGDLPVVAVPTDQAELPS